MLQRHGCGSGIFDVFLDFINDQNSDLDIKFNLEKSLILYDLGKFIAQKSIQIANCARTCMRRAECLPAYIATCPCCGVCNFTRYVRDMRTRNESLS